MPEPIPISPQDATKVAPIPAAVPIQPIEVTVIGGAGTGPGGPLPTPPLTTGMVATTPDHAPNIVVNVVTPLVAIVVRFINMFLTTLVGLLVAGMTPVGGKLLYTSDFFHLVVLCASLAFPGAALGLIKDTVTIFGRLEQKFPLGTGSI